MLITAIKAKEKKKAGWTGEINVYLISKLTGDCSEDVLLHCTINTLAVTARVLLKAEMRLIITWRAIMLRLFSQMKSAEKNNAQQ